MPKKSEPGTTGRPPRPRAAPAFVESVLPTDHSSAAVLSPLAVRAGPIVDHRRVFVGFDLSNADDPKAAPSHAPDYLLTVEQARDLVEQLRDALAVLGKPSKK
jgi:hypothetical protein